MTAMTHYGVLGVLQVPIALGLLRLSTEGRPAQTAAIDVIHCALDGGVRVLDTADSYALSDADLHYGEVLAREAIKAWHGPREDIRGITKAGMARPKGRWLPNARPEHLRKAVDGSLLALGVEQIFMLLLHGNDPSCPFEDSLATLAQLQQEFSGDVFLVTQNVDNLHERGGSNQVCHMHGELNSVLCRACHATQRVFEDYDGQSICPRCGASGKLRPDIVWFGEIPYHMEAIGARLSGCDLFIAVGTSGVVYPAAGFVQEALLGGAHTIEINRELSAVTGYFHHQRHGSATVEVVALVAELLAG